MLHGVDVGIEHGQRAFQNLAYTNYRSQVIHQVDLAGDRLEREAILNRLPMKREQRIVAMMSDIALAACDQIVDHDHPMTETEMQIDQVRADEAGASGHENRCHVSNPYSGRRRRSS